MVLNLEKFSFGKSIILLFLIILVPGVLGFQAGLDKIIYVTNSTMAVSGTADGASYNISADIYNSSNALVANGTGVSESTDFFAFTINLTNFSLGNYYVVVSQNNEKDLKLNFKVVGEELYFKVFIVDSNNTNVINTSTNVTSGSNFTDLLGSSISLSGTVQYGNETLTEGTYHFALVDSDSNNSYSKLYLDDDQNYSLYDNTEDSTGIVERLYKKKEIAKINNTNYLIAGIDSAGEEVIIAKAVNSSSFSEGRLVYYLIISENSAGEIVENENISIVIKGPDGSETEISNSTNSYGYYVGSLNLTEIGTYSININEGQGMEFINVESFKINTKTTDLSGNSINYFFPGDTARIKTTAKENGALINLTSISVEITYPNGSSISDSMEEETMGVYYYDITTPSDSQGSYSVRVSAIYSGNTQTNKIGFSVESTSFEMYTLNTEYLDEVESGGEGVFVEAFAPGKNITIAAMQLDWSKGGMESEEGTIDIETENISCEDVLEVLELIDDKGKSYELNSLGIMVRSFQNLSDESWFPENVNPPAGMMGQCMIVITNSSLPTGFYNLKVKLKVSGSEKINSASFSIQRILASGYTVDKNAEGFGFFSPGGEVNLKIKLTNMVTNEDLNGSQILNVKITEMTRDFPSYADVLSQVTNESYNSSTVVLSFVSPSSEGFYSVKFRFKANVSNETVEGEGRAFFELKKYIIFGNVQASEMGSDMKKPEENITLQVYVIDVDKGSLFDIGFSAGSSQMSCTGCSGYMVNVTQIFNEQLFKEVDLSDYNITEGSIINSTSGATVHINHINHAQDFDSGFYRVGLQVYNPLNESEAYNGWGYFEVRSFYVQSQKATWNVSGSLFEVESSDNGGRGSSEMQFETGEPAYILSGAMVPGPQSPEPLNISSASIINVLKLSGEMPVTVNYSGTVSERETATEQCNGEGNCTTIFKDGWVANISIPDAEDGNYIVNIRITTIDGDSEISTSWVTFSSFMLTANYRGSDTWWDPLFSNEELLNITFTGATFDEDPYNLSFAKPKFIFDKKKERPLKINSSIWNSSMTVCSGNICNVSINLDSFAPGRYGMDIVVNDSNGTEQLSSVGFEIKNVVFSIPQILQMYNWQSDSGDTGTINLNDNQDRCDTNNINLGYDQNSMTLSNSYILVNISESGDSIGRPYNFTFNDGSKIWNINLSSKPTNSISAAHYCMDSGFNFNQHNGPGDCNPGDTSLLILMNGTHAIVGYTEDMTSSSWVTQGIMPRTNGELAIASVGYNNDEAGNYTQIVNSSNYGRFTPQNWYGGGFMIIPRYFKTMIGGIFCVADDTVQMDQPRSWRQKQGLECGDNRDTVYVYSNGTSMWLGVNDNNLTGKTPLEEGSVTEGIIGLNWSVNSINITTYRQSLRMKLSDNRICGQSWGQCDEHGCTSEFYELIPPHEDSKFVFGWINLIQSPWQINETFGGSVDSSRYVYVYHNRTTLFMSNDTNLSGELGYAIGQNITDPYGGVWTVKTLSDSGLSLKGQNTLANLGSYVNMTYSKSGIVRFGQLREEELGSFKNDGGRAGIDIDGDGYTNATAYYILSDANTAGVYDTFFFSMNNTFTTPISVDANQSVRTFVKGSGNLTLLSIDPRADRVLFYTSEIGDWADLGDLATTGKIKIPFIVQKPNGDALDASVSAVGAYYSDSQGGRQYIKFPSSAITTIDNKFGEVIVNSSLSTHNFSTGQYVFEIQGNTSSEQFKLEEWNWPRINLRAYLTSDRLGKGGWINNFSNLTYDIYGERTGYRGLELSQVNLSREGYDGNETLAAVAENARNWNSTPCNFTAPGNANRTLQEEIHESQEWQINNPPYYFYFSRNVSNGNTVWVKAGDCNFTNTTNYTVGDYINITQENSTYMLQILAMNATNNQIGPYALIGVNITDPDTTRPIRADQMDNSGRWRLISLNISGTLANALLTNASTNPMCGVYGGDCITGMELTKTGVYNYSQSLNAGDNLSIIGFEDLYISSIGPNNWEGFALSDSSTIEGIEKPLFANMYVQDNTPLKIKVVLESDYTIDLNRDGDLKDRFYIILFDDIFDHQNNLTRILIDDDHEITPSWESSGGSKSYYDYSGIENESEGIVEQWGSLPTAIWSGNLEFGPGQENEAYRQLNWEQKAQWEVILFDDSNNRMLIGKDSWCGIDANDSLKLFLRAYQFNQTNIVNATVSLDKVYKFGFNGGGIYDPSLYNATNESTDSTGYAILNVGPLPSWDTDNGRGAEYLFRLLVTDQNNLTATSDKYARIGGSCNY